jgi:putative Mg2+ transporter-C (MgtC) family protein
VLGILSAFRRIEAWMPSESYASHYIRFERAQTMSEAEVRAFLAEHGFSVANMSYRTKRVTTSFTVARNDAGSR